VRRSSVPAFVGQTSPAHIYQVPTSWEPIFEQPALLAQISPRPISSQPICVALTLGLVRNYRNLL
jgi:hypothetical protein